MQGEEFLSESLWPPKKILLLLHLSKFDHKKVRKLSIIRCGNEKLKIPKICWKGMK